MSIESTAVAFVAATKKRAQARSHLSALRVKWMGESGAFFDKSESEGEEGYEEMMAALHDREQANVEYRRAKSRLFRACAAGVPVDAERSEPHTIAPGRCVRGRQCECNVEAMQGCVSFRAYGVMAVAPAQPQRRSAEGFLCYAWGESDKPVAQLVRTRDEVLAFFVAEWFGENPEAMCAENREQWDEAVAQFDGDWDGLDSTEWHFEIGGVRVTKVFFYAPSDGVAVLDGQTVSAQTPMK